MDNKDLVLEAIKHFGGVWPNLATHIIHNIDQNKFSEANLESESATVISKYLQIACTREEFEAHLQKLADAGPEGAEFVFLGDNKGAQLCYYKNIKDDYCQFFYSNYTRWSEKNRAPECSPLIPLPPRTPKQEQWKPEVGQDCEYKTQHQWIKITIDHIGKKFIVFHGEHGQEFSRRIAKAEFRPLKTEAEKEREKLIKLARETATNGVYGTPSIELDIETESALEVLIDAGWRPLND